MLRPTAVGAFVTLAAASLLVACAGGDTPHTAAPQPAAPTTTLPPVADGPVVVAVGDLVCSATTRDLSPGDPSQCRSDATAAVAKELKPEAVLLAGDIQYDSGATAEFASGYSVGSWASMKAITHPAPGNHEYSTTDAAPYYATFAQAAGPAGRGWYSFNIGDWHVIALNSNCKPAGGCGVGSPQEVWLRQDLAASRRACTLAFWHHPRWSSGIHGSDVSMDALWTALRDAHADVAISGHDHDYERFAPDGGLRQFVVGTGGRSLYPTFNAERGSEARNSTTFGVLMLRLGHDAYSWRFVPIADGTFTDSGTTSCR